MKPSYIVLQYEEKLSFGFKGCSSKLRRQWTQNFNLIKLYMSAFNSLVSCDPKYIKENIDVVVFFWIT